MGFPRFRQRRASAPQAGAAFTLIELLVVIAIIAILAAILFPVFAQAREKARQTACLSNQKQIATGIMMYAQDYDEQLLMGMWGTSASQTLCSWPVMIQPYIKSANIFLCPSAPGDAGVTPGTMAAPGGCGIANGFSVSYTYNYYLGGNNNPSGGVMTSSLPLMKNPSQTVMIVDGGTMAQATVSPDKWPEKRSSSATAAGGTTTANRLMYLLVHAGSSLMIAGTDYGAPMARHNGITNVLWADGHSKAAKIESFYRRPGQPEHPSRPPGATALWSPCLDPGFGCLPTP